MYTSPNIAQPPVAPCVGYLTPTTKKTKIQTNRQQTGLLPYSVLPIRGRKKKKKKKKTHGLPPNASTSHTLHKADTNHWTNLMRAETKRKKEFNPEAWKKETSNIVSLKK